MRRTLIPTLAALVGLLIACGPMPKTITSDERARLGAAAQACQREYPIETYEIDRFGGVTAVYRTTNPQAVSTEPFFECIRQKLESGSR